MPLIFSNLQLNETYYFLSVINNFSYFSRTNTGIFNNSASLAVFIFTLLVDDEFKDLLWPLLLLASFWVMGFLFSLAKGIYINFDLLTFQIN